jgi:hypothetical protein
MLPQYAVAIILIWTGILAAKSISGQTAGMAMGMANKVKGKALSAGKFGAGFGIGAADGMMAAGVNRMAKREKGVVGKVGRGLAAVRTAPDRVKNIYGNVKKKSDRVKEEAKAHGLSVGGGKFGGDSNAMTNLKNKQVAEMKKKFKDDNIDAGTLSKKLDKAGEVEARAIQETLAQMKEGIDDKVIERMIKNSKKTGNATTIKAVEKKAVETGNAHILMEHKLREAEEKIAKESGVGVGSLSAAQKNNARVTVSNKIYSKMDAKTFAKQEKTIKKASEGKADFLGVKDELTRKLNQTKFSRDIQEIVNEDTYNDLHNINATNL